MSTQLHEIAARASPVAVDADHFAAFSFVDAIVDVRANSALGRYHVPATIDEFPSCLVAEALGQLAAWVSMSAIDFSGRPVAALAGETRFHSVARPGCTLDLAVDIDSCDASSVSYRGTARADGIAVLELERCLGPMLPAADFDDPASLRSRFELLRNGGAQPDRFSGLDQPQVETVERTSGESVRAVLTVPECASFFADHFPRRPVFPATLLLNEEMKLATTFLDELADERGSSFIPVRMLNVKMRAFILPGQAVEIHARLRDADAGRAVVAFNARIDGKTVATSELEFTAAR